MNSKAGKCVSSVPDIRSRTYEFALRILRLCRQLHADPMGRILMSQLLRAGTAVGANVEEAQGGQSKRDFISKMSIARKEAMETHYWLRLLTDSGVLAPDLTHDVMNECDQIIRVLSAIILSAKRKS